MALPPRFADLKASIAASYPDFEQNATRSWAEILQELDEVTKQIKEQGVNVRLRLHVAAVVLHESLPSGVCSTSHK